MKRRHIHFLRANKQICEKYIKDLEAEKEQKINNSADYSNTERRIAKYKQELKNTEAKIKEFETILAALPDEELKEIAISYFVNGETLEAIADKHYLERTTVSKKLSRYFGKWQQSTNSGHKKIDVAAHKKKGTPLYAQNTYNNINL